MRSDDPSYDPMIAMLMASCLYEMLHVHLPHHPLSLSHVMPPFREREEGE